MGKGIAGLAAVVVSLLVFAGCGGSDSPTVDQQEYDRQLELVCNDGLQQREETFGKVSREFEELGQDELTPEVMNENLLKLVAVYENTTEEIEEIGLPEGKEKKAEEFVEAREEAAAKVRADPQGTRELLGEVFKRASDLAKTFGSQACAV